ncbi:ABC transporter substrate-binding protein [Vibrio aestuarianus]|nr:ABC transporter substrate-binding protein [Vibrio aestuarianus]MDE1335567.1 ABC transporter substrate-binding protein [Vibrio aestuarianus]
MAVGTMKRKASVVGKIVISIVVLLVITLLWVVKGHEKQTLTNNRIIKIGVSQTPLSSPFFIAFQQGFFTKHGVNVELIPCMGGVACSQALFEGQVDYATASESVVVFELFKRDDFALLTSFVESDNDLKLLTLESLEIGKLSDLKGKRVGIVKASASEFYFDSLLIANDLKDMPVEKVYLPAQELNSALFAFEVDAISAWEPYGYKTEVTASSDVLNLGLLGIYHLSFNLLSMKETAYSSHDEIVSILLALKDANEWISLNTEQSMLIVSKALGIRLHQLKWSWDDYVFRLSLGNALLSNIQLQARWAIDARLVAGNKPDFRSVLFSKPLEEVLHSEVSIK